MTAAERPALAGLVLAAGAGRRLRPLTLRRPKPLCPVGNVALLDHALARVVAVVGQPGAVAVNVCHGRSQLEAHLAERWPSAHVSVEGEALGTAGAVGPLRGWMEGRALLIVNGDTWCPTALTSFVDAWDGERIAVAVAGAPPLHARSGVVASILPWRDAATVAAEPAGLWERFWRERLAAGQLQSHGVDGPFVDCATPADYVRANLLAAEAEAEAAGAEAAGTAGAGPPAGSIVDPGARIVAGGVVDRSVVGAGAVVRGRVERSVLWPGVEVGAAEHLRRCVRADAELTVVVDP